eukprot:5963536-Pleurochrysis_carterae.AAC.3
MVLHSASSPSARRRLPESERLTEANSAARPLPRSGVTQWTQRAFSNYQKVLSAHTSGAATNATIHVSLLDRASLTAGRVVSADAACGLRQGGVPRRRRGPHRLPLLEQGARPTRTRKSARSWLQARLPARCLSQALF